MVLATRVFDVIPVVYPDGAKDARVVEIGLNHHEPTPAHPGEPPQYQTCDFSMGWATCPPPEIDPDWIDFVIEPDEEEIKAMNAEAKSLLLGLQ